MIARNCGLVPRLFQPTHNSPRTLTDFSGSDKQSHVLMATASVGQLKGIVPSYFDVSWAAHSDIRSYPHAERPISIVPSVRCCWMPHTHLNGDPFWRRFSTPSTRKFLTTCTRGATTSLHATYYPHFLCWLLSVP